MASHNSTCAVECFVRRLVCNLIVPPIFSAVRSTPNSWDNRGWRSLGVVESDDPAVQWILERSGPLHVLRVPLCPWPTNVLYDWPVIGNFTSSSLMWLQKMHFTVMGLHYFSYPRQMYGVLPTTMPWLLTDAFLHITPIRCPRMLTQRHLITWIKSGYELCPTLCKYPT